MFIIEKREYQILDSLLKTLEKTYTSFDYLKINIASPTKIKSWTNNNGFLKGQIFLPETINFKTEKPAYGGLFCQRIFGPTKSWRCDCGRYSNLTFNNINKICEICEVELTSARVRRYKMGYIELLCPILHIWYLKGLPNYLLMLLKCFDEKIKLDDVKRIIYILEGNTIINKDNPLFKFFTNRTLHEISSINNKILERKLFFEQNLSKKKEENDDDIYDEEMYEERFRTLFNSTLNNEVLVNNRKGAEIIKYALENISIKKEILKFRSILNFNQENRSIIKRIRLLENFLSTNTDPTWMVLTVLPVLPPTLRPLMELESGTFISSDLNELYKLILIRNNRLFNFLTNNEQYRSISTIRMLQIAVDALIDNAHLPKNIQLIIGNKPLKSLSEALEGKEGRFRHNLLGKRVDFSGRAVITINPNLRLNQCSIPYKAMLTLFQPFILNKLMNFNDTILSKIYSQLILKKRKPFIFTVLNKLASKYTVLLNRAPTLHRFGIQSFEPIINIGNSIELHPLVCTGFNADFDGDQMAIHLPLLTKSQNEAKFLMNPSENILSPADGNIILKPSQDMVIGCFYLTFMLEKSNSFIRKWYISEESALNSFYIKNLDLNTPILVNYSKKDFNFIIKESNLYLYINTLGEKKIKIYKQLLYKNKKIYIFSNIGILILTRKKNNFELDHVFCETTIGRILFAQNFNNSIKLLT